MGEGGRRRRKALITVNQIQYLNCEEGADIFII